MDQAAETPEKKLFLKNSLKLYEALTSGAGLQGILAAAGTVFGNPILISDPSFKLIAHIEPPGIDNVLWNQIIKNGFYPEAYLQAITNDVELYNKVYSDGAPMILTDATGPEKYMSKMIAVNGKPVGFSTCLEYSRAITALDIRLFDVFCRVVGSELRSDETSRQYHARRYDYFISELLSAPAKADFMEERMKEVGLELKANLFVLAAEFRDKKMRREYQMEYFKTAFERAAPPGHCIVYRNSLVMLISLDQKEVFEPPFTDNISKQLELADMLGGVSHRFQRIEELNVYYKQARAAIRIGKRVEKGNRLFNYGDMAFCHMLDTIKESEDLKRFCSPQVFDVIEYDAEYNTNYSITAYIFLCSNRNPVQAAKHLGIHRNTVDYRIKRLEELFGIDFESSEATFSLELSFRILQFLALPPFGPDSMVH